MSLLKVVLPLALGAGALFALTSSASAKTPSGGQVPGAPNAFTAAGMSPQLLAKIQTAVATADPVQMRMVADEVERAGFKPQADSLRAAATAVQTAIQQAPAAPRPPTASPAPPGPPPPAAPPIVSTSPGLPPIINTQGVPIVSPGPSVLPSAPAASPSPERQLAARMASNLTTSPAGREDQNLVRVFQTQEKARGHYVGNIDGLYGPKSALALATDFGIVPPKPRYWPKNNKVKAKQDYANALLGFAARDLPRQEEWSAAARAAQLA